MTINERLALLIKHLGYKPYSFSRQIAVSSSSTLPNILRSNKRKPSFDVLNRILTRFPNVNARWLITGDENEEMFIKEKDMPLINDRISKVLDYHKMDIGDFIKKTGLHPKEVNSVLIKREEPSEKFLKTFEAYFPNINPIWLYHNGKNKMFKGVIGVETEEDKETGIPYYNIEITDNKPKLGPPVSIIKIQGFEDCNLSVTVWGGSMAPDYNARDIILCRASPRDLIMYGEAYLIFTDDTIFLRFVKGGGKKDHVQLVPGNDRYDIIHIPKENILNLYLVKGKIIRSMI